MDRETVRRFREDLKVAGPEERARKWGNYGAWLKEGANAQGFVGRSGAVIMGGVRSASCWPQYVASERCRFTLRSARGPSSDWQEPG